MSTGKVIFGTLAGIAVGSIAGVLLAPEKGSITRKQIMDKGSKLRDSIKQKFESTKNSAENLAEKGKEKYDEVKNDVKNTAANIKQNVAANINQATSKNSFNSQ